MRTVRIISAIDSQTGELGYALKTLNINPDLYMISTDRIQIAHDLIEHVNGIEAIGSIHDELQALGAIWYVRGQWGDLRRDGIGSRYSVEENIAADIVRMTSELNYIDFKPRPTKRFHDRWGVSEIFRRILDIAWKEVEEEAEQADTDKETLLSYRDSIVGYMMDGYRKVRRRYRGDNGLQANNIFWAICDALPTHSPDYEGQEFRLSYDSNRAFFEELTEGL